MLDINVNGGCIELFDLSVWTEIVLYRSVRIIRVINSPTKPNLQSNKKFI